MRSLRQIRSTSFCTIHPKEMIRHTACLQSSRFPDKVTAPDFLVTILQIAVDTAPQPCSEALRGNRSVFILSLTGGYIGRAASHDQSSSGLLKQSSPWAAFCGSCRLRSSTYHPPQRPRQIIAPHSSSPQRAVTRLQRVSGSIG